MIDQSNQQRIGQYDVMPGAIKQRACEAWLTFSGLEADLPSGATETKQYFATDTGILYQWNGSSWSAGVEQNATQTLANKTLVNPHVTGEIITNSGYVPIYRGRTTDFNTALSPGQYYFASSNITGCWVSSLVYGTLIVYVNNGLPHDNANNWIWQFAYGTDGINYMRHKVNNGSWSVWAPLSNDTAWINYTPTITASTGTFTTVSATGYYSQIGRTVNFQETITMTNIGTAAGAIYSTLPVNAIRDGWMACGREQISTGTMVQGYGGTNGVSLFTYNNSSIIGTGYSVRLSGTYEAA